MKKEEFKIGEVFQCGLIKLKVKESTNCSKCYLCGTCLCRGSDSIIGSCFKEKRSDKTDVIFVKVEE